MRGIEIRDVWKEYAGHTVLERLNITIPQGEFCTIVGPSGCGKTTFLRMLLSMERPSRGEILLDGDPLAAEPGPDRGIVFQRYSVYPHLTALQNVLLGFEFERAPLLGRLFGAARKRAIEEAENGLRCVGLEDARHRYPSELSGGMQQRLAIAQTLTRKPKVLLLDEPFGALDSGTKLQMYELMRRIWRDDGMTVFMITHDLKEAFELATRVLAFDKVRHDPQDPSAYGATVTYDLPLDSKPDRQDMMERWRRIRAVPIARKP